MNKGLTALVALGSIALATTEGCSRRHAPVYYPPQNNYYPQPAARPAPQPQYQIIDSCTNPKILTLNNDPRFAGFTERHFAVKAMDANGNPIGEPRWVYGPGERFFIAANYEGQPVMNSVSNFVFQDPSDRHVSWENKRITPDDAFHIKGFNVNDILRKVGPGIYTASYGVDGKLLVVLKIKIDN